MIKFSSLQALISKNLTAAIYASGLTPQQPKAHWQSKGLVLGCSHYIWLKACKKQIQPTQRF